MRMAVGLHLSRFLTDLVLLRDDPTLRHVRPGRQGLQWATPVTGEQHQGEGSLTQAKNE